MSKYSTKFKRWFYQDKVQYELRSFFHTWLAVMLVDGGLELMALYNGDFSQTTLIALVSASVRSVIKALFQLLLPQVFNAKTVSSGQGSVSVSMTKGIDSVTVKKVK